MYLHNGGTFTCVGLLLFFKGDNKNSVAEFSITLGPRVEEAMLRSIRWLDRCIAAHARPTEQNLFAIIQGGLDPELRKTCVRGT